MKTKNVAQQFILVFVFTILSGAPHFVKAQQVADTAHAFESEITAFEKTDARNPPSRNAILFVGSSSIRKWTTLKKDFPDKNVINRGFGGSQFSDLLYYANRIVFPYHPKQIIVYEGDNDVAAGISADSIFARFKTFVYRVKKRLPKTEIDFISIKPSPSRSNLMLKMRVANDLIHSYALMRKGVKYIDVYHPMLDDNGKVRQEIFSSDNLHMNPTGYNLWQKIIRPYLD